MCRDSGGPIRTIRKRNALSVRRGTKHRDRVAIYTGIRTDNPWMESSRCRFAFLSHSLMTFRVFRICRTAEG
jgi:hypothetical protein